MDRTVSDTNILNKFTIEFCKILEEHVDYIIVSGFVAIASGRTRGTEDIDIITRRMNKEAFTKLHKDLVDNGFVCMQSDNPLDIYEYLADKTSVRYTWKNRLIPEIELKFVKDQLDEEQFLTKQKLDLTGLDLWFSSVEFNIAFKEEYLKSDKDIEDAKHLRLVYEINEEEVKRIKRLIRKVRL